MVHTCTSMKVKDGSRATRKAMAVSVPRRGESGGIAMIGPDLSRVAVYVRPGAADANSKYCASCFP